MLSASLALCGGGRAAVERRSSGGRATVGRPVVVVEEARASSEARVNTFKDRRRARAPFNDGRERRIAAAAAATRAERWERPSFAAGGRRRVYEALDERVNGAGEQEMHVRARAGAGAARLSLCRRSPSLLPAAVARG